MALRPIPGWKTDFVDPESGELAAPSMPLGYLHVYGDVTLSGDTLVFGFPDFGRSVRPPTNLLHRFLDAQTPPQVLAFAKRFGWMRQPGWTELRAQFRAGVDVIREPLSLWHERRWELDFLLSLAATLRSGAPPATDPALEFQKRGIWVMAGDTLADLSGQGPAWESRSRSRQLHVAARLLADRTNAIVNACQIHPALVIGGDTRELRFDLVFHDGSESWGSSLWGALVVQFVAAITGSGFAVCSSCGRAFIPKRRQPAFGKRRYCQRCGRRAAVRDAKAALRARKREANANAVTGESQRGRSTKRRRS